MELFRQLSTRPFYIHICICICIYIYIDASIAKPGKREWSESDRCPVVRPPSLEKCLERYAVCLLSVVVCMD